MNLEERQLPGDAQALFDRRAQEIKWREFASEYIVDFKGTRAIERCKAYQSEGSSASAIASQLLKRPEVQKYIVEALEDRKDRLELSQDLVVKELLRIGVSDVSNYTKWGPNGLEIKPSEDLSEDDTRALESIEMVESYDSYGQVKNRKVKVKVHNKNAALDALMKHLGGYRENNKFIVEDNRESQVRGVLEVLQTTRNRITHGEGAA